MATVAPASVVPKGSAGAEADPFARFCPNKLTMDPGESGAFAAKLAPLTAAPITGASDDAPSPPVTSRVPVRLREGSLAVTVTVTGPAPVPACHVLCHVPLCRG